jgi:hypothetical protein
MAYLELVGAVPSPQLGVASMVASITLVLEALDGLMKTKFVAIKQRIKPKRLNDLLILTSKLYRH